MLNRIEKKIKELEAKADKMEGWLQLWQDLKEPETFHIGSPEGEIFTGNRADYENVLEFVYDKQRADPHGETVKTVRGVSFRAL